MLRDYQHEGVRFLQERRIALLADEPGLGKTAVTIVAADDPSWPRRVLIVCPAVVREHWRREIYRWARIPPVVTVPLSLSDPPGATTVVSYEWATHHADELDCLDLLVLDEAHLLKSPQSTRARRILGELVHKSARTWMLTGTPAPNHPGEMWTYLRVMGATSLPHDAFVARYSFGVMGPRGWIPVRENRARMPELRALMAPHVLRRTAEECMPELPPMSFSSLPVTLPSDALERTAGELLEEYREQEAHMSNFLHTHGSSEESMSALGSLARSVPTLRRITGLSKVPLALEWIRDEFPGREKLVLFHVHREVGEWLHRELPSSVRIYGETSPAERETAIRQFNSYPRCRFLVASLAACGLGVNLAPSGCSNALFVESEWVPAMNEQALARLHRIPQTRPVLGRVLVLSGSVDEAVMGILSRKARMVAALWETS